jgi:hypothetical protein
LQDPGETIHFEQNTMGDWTGQLDSDFLFPSPTGRAIGIPAQRAKPG